MRLAKKRPHNNRIVITDDGRFDSQGELERWQQLKLLAAAGEITELRRQVPYVIAPAARINGRMRPARKWIADAVYVDRAGKTIVEDYKGRITPVYTLKRHLMMTVHGIEILEVADKPRRQRTKAR